MIKAGAYSSVIKKLLRYAKNITGTKAYWNQAKEQLKATINQIQLTNNFLDFVLCRVSLARVSCFVCY